MMKEVGWAKQETSKYIIKVVFKYIKYFLKVESSFLTLFHIELVLDKK